MSAADLDLLERSLLNATYGENPLELRVQRFMKRLRHPSLTRRRTLNWPPRAHSMLSPKAINNVVRELVEITLRDGVPGDYIETGVRRGSACTMLRGDGISDAGLAAICQRNRVPTLPRDYWSKKEARKVKQRTFVQVDDLPDRTAQPRCKP